MCSQMNSGTKAFLAALLKDSCASDFLYTYLGIVYKNENMNVQYYKIKPLSPPIWYFQPSTPVYSKINCRYLLLNLSPNHIHSIILLWGVLEFKVMRNVSKPGPHFNPFIFWKLPELTDHIAWLQCLII